MTERKSEQTLELPPTAYTAAPQMTATEYPRTPVAVSPTDKTPRYPPAGSGDWINGLFGCFTNLESCLLSCFLPCIVYAENKEALLKTNHFAADAGVYCCANFWTGTACLLEINMRQEIRTRSGIGGDPFSDMCTHCCCHCCALAQEREQIKHLKSMGRL